MKKTILAALLLTAFVNPSALADEAQPQAKPDTELTFNAALTSDYRYRGISQTRLEPALQGGADFVHNAVRPVCRRLGLDHQMDEGCRRRRRCRDRPVRRQARRQSPSGVGYDVGVLTYVYPSNGLARVAGFASANTTELYGQLSYGPALVKYSHAVTNLFGFVDSKNSGYLDLAANPGRRQGPGGQPACRAPARRQQRRRQLHRLEDRRHARFRRRHRRAGL